jgi:nucleotide-binding universal stress UspA family protein
MLNKRIERILVPIDLSTFTVPALRLADLFRERLKASVTVLHANEPVYPIVAYEDVFGVAWKAPASHEMVERELRQYISAAVWEPDKYELRIEDGIASDVIHKSAYETKADLIVMGTHGRTGMRRALMGSVAETVLHETDVPLLTVNASAHSGERNAIRSILCPVNFTAAAHDALEFAVSIAEAFNAGMTILNVDEDGEGSDETERDFAGWVEPKVRDHCSFRRMVVTGDAAEAVLDAANYFHSDLLVIGAQHRRFSDATVIGATTERLTRFASQPVLTVMRRRGGVRAVAAAFSAA